MRKLFFGGIAVIGLLSLILSGFLATPTSASGETITGSTSFSGLKNVATPITDIQVSGMGDPTVPVRLFVTSGTLTMSTTTGLTFAGASSGAQLEFTGTLTNVNSALATLTYTRTSVGTDTLEMSLVDPGEVFFSDNGHLYEYVSSTLTANGAKSAAEARSKYGVSGYLATITSQPENDFVADRLENAGWMGASDSAVEGAWRWVTGPENGTQFWSGTGSGSTVGGNYANWANGEPNDASGEDCAQFLSGGSGQWNDLNCGVTTLPGYVVEYGSGATVPTVSSHNATLTTGAIPNNPTSLGASYYVDGSWGRNAQPTLQFSLNDEDSQEELYYVIQIDDSSDFSSPVIEYQSGPKSQGSFNFVVGQAPGDGTSGVGDYVIGSEDQMLPEGSYYWRVKSIDEASHESSYVSANSGAIAFRVDTTAPTVPSFNTASSPTNDSTPSFTWSTSTDDGSGLYSLAYDIQWSQDPGFGSVTTTSVANPSYTLGTPLADGTWYFRVRCRDAVQNVSDFSSTSTVVVDTATPSVDSTTPSNNANDVLRNRDLSVTFNEDVALGSGNITIHKLSDDSEVESVDVNSDKAILSGKTLTINPAGALDFSTQYYILIPTGAVTDLAGNGFSGINNSSSWSFTTEGSDIDADGVPSIIEEASPNSGDANNDGTPDSQQANVATFVSSVTGEYVTLSIDNQDCSISRVESVNEASNNSQDKDYSYPIGMLDFSLDCADTGDGVIVTQFYFNAKAEGYLLRKYNPNSKQYITVETASISEQTVGDSRATAVSYAVNDGGVLDTDGVANGRIVDPAGLAVPVADLAGTGTNAGTLLAVALTLLGVSILAYTFLSKRSIDL